MKLPSSLATVSALALCLPAIAFLIALAWAPEPQTKEAEGTPEATKAEAAKTADG